MDFIKVAKRSDFANRNSKVVRILGRSIGLFKKTDGSYRAMEITCKHQNAELPMTHSQFPIATCSRHQWKYNMETGACLQPGQEWACLRHFPLRLENDNLWVCLTPVDTASEGEE